MPDASGAQEDPDGPEVDDGYTGELRDDLRRAMGEDGWLQYRPLWEKFIACDRRGVQETFAQYRLARVHPDPRKRPHNAGEWLRHVFIAHSKKWRARR